MSEPKVIAEKLKETIEENPYKAIEDIIGFSNVYASSKKQRYDSIILKSALNTQYDDESISHIKDKMKQLVDSIVSDAGSSQVQEEVGERLKKYFVERKPGNKVVLEANNITKTYPRFKLEDVTIRLMRGEITGVVGENGNGKTTLLKILAGLIKPDAGIPVYQFEENTNLTDWRKIKLKVAYLPQEFGKFYGTVSDMLRLTSATHGIKGEQNELAVEFIINRLGLGAYKDANWQKLSGGYRLRFALARTLIWNPEVLILDEPLANLDINGQTLLLRDLRDLANSVSNPISIIISSQLLEEIEYISDNMIVLRQGKMIYNGKTSEIGLRRDENTYEIRSACSRDELKELFKELGVYQVEDTGFTFIITTSKQIGLHDLMDFIVRHNLPVQSVDDISNSSKKIILKTNLLY